MIKNIIKKNCYFDSVFLMTIANRIKSLSGIKDCACIMATDENKELLKNSKLLSSEGASASNCDLLIALSCDDKINFNSLSESIENIINTSQHKTEKEEIEVPKTLEMGLKTLQKPDIVFISVPGKYAKWEAQKALRNNISVMIFSDNVSVEDELELKTIALKKNLLVMGPDCGTSIIDMISFGFGNVIRKGNIGIIGASGTGIQEVSVIINNFGGGITQAYGTGSRDLTEKIGGITTFQALKILENDAKTKVIVLIAKTIADSVKEKILKYKFRKKIVFCFLNQKTLQDAAFEAIKLAGIKSRPLPKLQTSLLKKYCKLLTKDQIYISGIFAGGSLCEEALLVLSKYFNNDLFSNISTDATRKIIHAKTKKHSLLDLGDDEFTKGIPHPMIDSTKRCEMIIKEARRKEVGVILFDVILGYGSNPDPAGSLIPAIKEVRKLKRDIIFIAHLCGTEKDFQNYNLQKQKLETEHVLVFPTNVMAAEAAAFIISRGKIK